MADISENTVSSKNQVGAAENVFGEEKGGKKLLFLGNSITLHSPAPQIGWTGSWGMAASCKEKDYVHQTMRLVRSLVPDASFLVAQVSAWEREFWREEIIVQNYGEAVRYGADIIVMRAVENVPEAELDKHSFEEGYIRLVEAMNKGGAKIVLTTSFWPAGRRDEKIRAIAQKRGYILVELNDLGKDDRYTAKGLFEHAGVAAHPGDAGMAAIAQRLFEAIKPAL